MVRSLFFRPILKVLNSSSHTASNLNRQLSTSPQLRINMTNRLSNNSQPLIYFEEYKDKGYGVLKLNRPPVNSLSLEFLTELNIQLDKIEENKDINGVILTSNCPNIYSAGLDITEMYQCKRERCGQFWTSFQDFFIKLYGSNKIFIAAINGHAPAGGCMIALCCDYRLMANGPYKTGLNETLLGIKAPFWLADVYTKTIGNRESEKALQLGSLYSPEQALKVNLIDEICAPQELLTKAEQHMQKWLKIPTVARELTKSSMRRDTLSKLLAQRESDVEFFVEHVVKDDIQNALRTYLESLKSRKSSKL